MKTVRFVNKWGIASLLLLAAIIIAGGLIIWSKSDKGQAIEITLAPEREIAGDIHISGEVKNPGIYPLERECNIEEVLRMAGGLTGDADTDSLALYVAARSEHRSPQRIDINRAEAWLLEALPGIGETRAQAIIEYREKNGLFRSTSELISVEGIGEALYEEIKQLVTVTD
jgi:competence protein ComEA